MLTFITASGLLIMAVWIFSTKEEMPEPKEKFPIVYPMEPMFQNYISIVKELEEVSNQQDLNTAYVRIIIFEGCYSEQDASSFTSELIDLYNQVEKELC